MKINDDSPEKHTIFAENQWMISRKGCAQLKTSASGNLKSQQASLYNTKKSSSPWFDPNMLLAKKINREDPNNLNFRQTKKNLLKQIEKGLPDMKIESEIGGKSIKIADAPKSNKIFDESTFRKDGSIKKLDNKKQQKYEGSNKIRKVSVLSLKSIDSLHQNSPQLIPNTYHKKPSKNNIFMPVTTISRQNFDNSHYNNQKYENKRFHTDSEMQYNGEIKRLQSELKKSEIVINSLKIKQLEGEVAKLKEKDKVYDQIIASLITEKEKNAQAKKQEAQEIARKEKEEKEAQIRKQLKKQLEEEIKKSLKKEAERERDAQQLREAQKLKEAQQLIEAQKLKEAQQLLEAQKLNEAQKLKEAQKLREAQQLKQAQKKSSALKRVSSIDKYSEDDEKVGKKKPETMKNENKYANSQQKRAKTQMQDESPRKTKQALNYHVLADHQKEIQTQKQFMLINPQKTREKLEKCYFQLKRFTVPEININPFRIPKVPNPPRIDQTVEDYLRLARELCHCLNYHVQQIDIVIRRYKNCINFRLIEKGIIVIWGFDGKLYVGDWVQLKEGEGKKEGSGLEFTNSYCYKGQFYDSKKSGVGIAQFYNGNVYEGEWQNGKMEGKGVYFEKTSSIYYQGQWIKGELRGRGFIKYSKKHFYTGELNNFTKSGKGTEFYENGDIYEGSFEKGEQNGYGIFYSSSGQFYVGYFKNSLKNGTGLLLTNKFASKSQKPQKEQKSQKDQKSQKLQEYYYGQFSQGDRSGYGIQRNIQNSYYLGYFFKNVPHGPGILQNSAIFEKNRSKNSAMKISGIWKNGSIVVKNKNIDGSQKSYSRDFSQKI